MEPFLYLFIGGCAGDRHADSQKEGEGCPLGWFVFEQFLRVDFGIDNTPACLIFIWQPCWPRPAASERMGTFDDSDRKTDGAQP